MRCGRTGTPDEGGFALIIERTFPTDWGEGVIVANYPKE